MIQIVHYPLFSKVGDEQFKLYSHEHQRLITYVVLPLMFVEIITSFWLWSARPARVGDTLVLVGIALVLIIWASTFLLQVPQHAKLTDGFDATVHQRLVMGNWIRTVAWTTRGILVAYMAWCVSSP